jgi:hypothetical protein
LLLYNPIMCYPVYLFQYGKIIVTQNDDHTILFIQVDKTGHSKTYLEFKNHIELCKGK